MDLIDLQKKVQLFIEEKSINTSIDVRMIDLVSEVGELSKEVLKGTEYGNKSFHVTDEWTSEIGDVLFSLISIANSTDISLEECLLEALDKYEKRFNRKGSLGSDR